MDKMTGHELNRLQNDENPLRRMRAMLHAVEIFAFDLATDEPVDPSEGLTRAEVTEIGELTIAARRIMDAMYKRTK